MPWNRADWSSATSASTASTAGCAGKLFQILGVALPPNIRAAADTPATPHL